MLRTPLALVALSFALAIASAVPQGRCDSDGEPALGIVEVGTPAGIFYVDDRNFVTGNGIWMYQESNGVYDDVNGHLQRGSACGGGWAAASPFDPAPACTVPADGEICVDVGDWDPDLLIF